MSMQINRFSAQHVNDPIFIKARNWGNHLLSLSPLPNVAMLKEVNSEAHEYNNKIIFVDCIEEFSWAVVERIP